MDAITVKFYFIFSFPIDDNLGIQIRSHKVTGYGSVRKSGGSGGGHEKILMRGRDM